MRPNRVIAGTGSNATGPDQAKALQMLEVAFTQDGFKVMGEMAPQYDGVGPSDPRLDPYFAIAS